MSEGRAGTVPLWWLRLERDFHMTQIMPDSSLMRKLGICQLVRVHQARAGQFDLRCSKETHETQGYAVTVGCPILTIDHSTHPIEEFLDLLTAHEVEQVVDVRTIPKSRRNPQFNCENLAKALRGRHIRYVHLPGLGGLRHPRRNSANTGWRNSSFRGYADYMQTPDFERSLKELGKDSDAFPFPQLGSCSETVRHPKALFTGLCRLVSKRTVLGRPAPVNMNRPW
jgi:Protein of unknown function, DUF488